MARGTTALPEKVSIDVGYQPHPKQLEILRSPARFKVIAAGRRGGKTEIEAVKQIFGDAAGFPGAIRGSRCWWVGPDYPRAKIGWNLFKKFAQNIPTGMKRVSEEDKRIDFPMSGGFVQVKSGFDPNSLRGEGLDHCGLDEFAFGKMEAWTEGIRPALADRKGSADFISTPSGFNHFYDLYEMGSRRERDRSGGEYESFHFTSYHNPHVENSEIDAAWEEYKRQGKEHVFRQEFLAEFLEGAGLPIFKREWFESGRNRYDANDQRLLRSGIGWWIAADTGNKDKKEDAYSVFIVGQLDPSYRLLIREVVRGRWTFDQLPGLAIQLARRYRGSYTNSLRYMPIEDAASGIALNYTLKHSGPPWLRGKVVPIKPIPKEVNWNQASVWCSRDMVKLPYPDESNASWLLDFETEIFNVAQGSDGKPAGSKFFDQADAFSILVNFVKTLFARAYGRRRNAA